MSEPTDLPNVATDSLTSEVVIDRRYVIDQIDTWLSATCGERIFLLVGFPGSGKSVLSRILARKRSPVDSYCSIFTATHHCNANDARSVTATHFIERLVLQFSHHAEFNTALMRNIKRLKRSEININVQQTVSSGRDVTGVVIRLGDLAVLDAFFKLFQEPLTALVDADKSRCWPIVVDGLDEAAKSGEERILTLLSGLKSFPAQFKVLVTTRPDDRTERALSHLGIKRFHLDQDYPEKTKDHEITEMAFQQISQSRELESNLDPSLTSRSLAAMVAERAEGNFLYASFVVPFLGKVEGPINLRSLDSLPSSMSGVYLAYLDQLCRDPRRWMEDYRPICGLLAIAQVALSDQQIARFVGMDVDDTRCLLSELAQVMELCDDGAWRLFHRSFAEFLFDNDNSGSYSCDEQSQHRRLMSSLKGDQECDRIAWAEVDSYMVDFAIFHQLRSGSASSDIKMLFSPDFVSHKVSRRDQQAIIEDLRRILDHIATSLDLHLLVFFSWLFACMRDKLSQEIAPPLIPLYVKIGQVEKAIKLANELDARSVIYSDGLHSAKLQLARTLAEIGLTNESLEIVNGATGYKSVQIIDRIIHTLAMRDSLGAVEFLARTKYVGELSAETCGALAAFPECIDLALARAGSDSYAIEAVANQAAKYDLGKAKEIVSGDDIYWHSEIVGGIKFDLNRSRALRKIAVNLAASKTDQALGLLSECDVEDREVGLALIVPHLKLDLDRQQKYLKSLKHKPWLHSLAAAYCSSLAQSPDAYDLRVPKPKLHKFSYGLSSVVEVASAMPMELLALCPKASATSLSVADWAAHHMIRRSVVDSPNNAAVLLVRWIGALDSDKALQLRERLEEWDNCSAANSLAEGLAHVFAKRGVKEVLLFFEENANLATHFASIEAATMLSTADSIRLIESIEPKYDATRTALIGIAAGRTAQIDESTARNLLALLPSYTSTAFFRLADEVIRRVLANNANDVPCSEPFLEGGSDGYNRATHAYWLLIRARKDSSSELAVQYIENASDVLTVGRFGAGYFDPLAGNILPTALKKSAVAQMTSINPERALELAEQFNCDGDEVAIAVERWWQSQLGTSSVEKAGRLSKILNQGSTLNRAILALSIFVDPVVFDVFIDQMAVIPNGITDQVLNANRNFEKFRNSFHEALRSDIETRLEATYILRALSYINPNQVKQILHHEAGGSELWWGMEDILESILCEIGKQDYESAAKLARRFYVGDGARGRYLQCYLLRGVVRGVASRDWIIACKLARDIGDKFVRGRAVTEMTSVRLKQNEFLGVREEELLALINLIDVQEETSRENALRILLQHPASDWPTPAIKRLISAVLMGNSTTALNLAGMMFQFLAETVPDSLDEFTQNQIVDLLSY